MAHTANSKATAKRFAKLMSYMFGFLFPASFAAPAYARQFKHPFINALKKPRIYFFHNLEKRRIFDFLDAAA